MRYERESNDFQYFCGEIKYFISTPCVERNKMNKKNIFSLLILLSVVGIVCGQDSTAISAITTESSTKKHISPIENIKLPSIDVFYKNTTEHPSVRIYDTRKKEELAKLGMTRVEWLDYVRLVGNYQYGKNNTLIYDINNTGSLTGYSDEAISSYGVGVAVSIPLGDPIVQHKKTVAQKAVVKRIKYEYEIALEERKIIILQAYNAVLRDLATLKAKSDAIAIYNAQMKISEQEFINGNINASTLSLERSRRADAIINYEEGKAALYEHITLLELLSGVKLLNQE